MRHGRFIKGDIVVVPSSFSDLTQAKRRPSLIISELEGDDLILRQITRQSIRDKYAVSIDENDFETGRPRRRSNVRPNRIWIADRHIILYQVAHLKSEKMEEIINSVIAILRQ